MSNKSESREMVPDIQDIANQIAAVQQDVALLTSGLSDTQLNWRPDPSEWSIAQCLDHLVKAAIADMETVSKSAQDARNRNLLSDGPFEYGAISKWFVNSVEPPPKQKAKAKAIFQPAQSFKGDQIILKFQDTQDCVIQAYKKVAGVDLAKAKAPAPVGPFKLPLGQKMRLTAAHARRHVYQARQVTKSPNFPKA
jgi:hypothetical protein